MCTDSRTTIELIIFGSLILILNWLSLYDPSILAQFHALAVQIVRIMHRYAWHWPKPRSSTSGKEKTLSVQYTVTVCVNTGSMTHPLVSNKQSLD